LKRFKILFIAVIVIGLAAVGVYYFGTKMVSDKVMEQVSTQLENSGEMETIKEQVKQDPNLQKFVSEGASVNGETLPFQTKEEAVRQLVKKFNVNELQDMQTDLKNGNKQEVWHKLEGKLTEEELLALKVLAYKELNQ
jgi:cell division protein FtsX